MRRPITTLTLLITAVMIAWLIKTRGTDEGSPDVALSPAEQQMLSEVLAPEAAKLMSPPSAPFKPLVTQIEEVRAHRRTPNRLQRHSQSAAQSPTTRLLPARTHRLCQSGAPRSPNIVHLRSPRRPRNRS
ncbi:MAG: hypothetical protein ACI835_000420 [Planctomycetota bacterium]|jgi:hypothetical protein